MRLRPRVISLFALMMLLISYQNFTPVERSEFDSENTLKIMNEMNSFEQHDRGVPTALATPSGGSDLSSVGSNWAERQGTLLLNGYDKKLEESMNEKLNSWLHDSSTKGSSEEAATSTDKNTTEAGIISAGHESKKPKQNLRFARLNSLKYDIGENTSFDVTADPGNTRLNYSQALTQKTKLGVEHRTAGGQTQMFLRYDW